MHIGYYLIYMYVLLFLCKASHKSILIDESNIMFKIHACTRTCMIQSDFIIQPLVSTCMSHSNFMQVFTWHKDYNVMLMSEV